MTKGIICILLCTLLLGIVPPVSGGSGDFNIEAGITRYALFLPHLAPDGERMIFMCSAFNEGPEESTQGTVKFEVRRIFRIFSNASFYDEWIFDPLTPRTGRGRCYAYQCHHQGIIPTIYLAKVTIDIDDNNPFDNSNSFLFFAIL